MRYPQTPIVVTGDVAGATAAKEAAEAARDEAITQAGNAADSATLSDVQRIGAEAARDIAVTKAGEAAASAAAAQVNTDLAIDARLADETTPNTNNDRLVTPEDLVRRAETADFTPSGFAAFILPVRDKMRQFRTLFDFINPVYHTDIQNGTDTHDLTAAINSALDSGEAIVMNEGIFRLTDKLVMKSGQLMQGRGRSRSIFAVDADFNMDADCVLQLNSSEPGSILRDIEIQFDQPSVTSRAGMVQYPYAIKCASARAKIGGVRITGAWNGFDARGNPGGLFIDDIEIGAINQGMIIDGALDFMKIGFLHLWPWGFQDANRIQAWRDQSTQGLRVGRIDGLTIGSLLTYHANAIFETTANGSPTGSVGFAYFDLDGSDLDIRGGTIQIGRLEGTGNPKGSSLAVRPKINVSGGYLGVETGEIRGGWGAAAGCAIKTSGTGVFQWGGGRLEATDETVAALEHGSSGMAKLDNIIFNMPNVNRSVAYINQLSASVGLQVTNCTASNNGGPYTGDLVSIASDNVRHQVQNNDFGGWGYSVPANANLGQYGSNKLPLQAFTPVLAFTTTNDLVPVYTVQTGRYRHEDNGTYFAVRLVGTTNAYSTSAGGLVITGLPVQNKGVDSIKYPLGAFSGLNLGTNYTGVAANLPVNSSTLSLQRFGNNVVIAGVSTPQLPASTAFEIVVSGFISSR